VISSSPRPLFHNTQHTPVTDIYASGGIRIHNLHRRTARDLRLRPCVPWAWPDSILYAQFWKTDWNMPVETDPLPCCKSLSFTRLLTAASNSTTCLCILSCTFAQVIAAHFSFHSARVVRQLATFMIWAALNGSKFANQRQLPLYFLQQINFRIS